LLVAVPVKSFDSGDSNRDLHMLQATRGGQFPMVSVRTRLPEAAAASATIHADLEIQFAGQTVEYKQVPFQLEVQGKHIRISGTIPATLSDFKIDPPSLLVSRACQERNAGARGYDLAFAVNARRADRERFRYRCPHAGVYWL